jgi:hypothetical protein
MNHNLTDRDCINLSELAYQSIKGLSTYPTLFDAFYANDKGQLRDDIPHGIKENYKKEISTFPTYYIPTFEKYKLIDFDDENNKSGYYAAAFKNIHTNDIVISNRGTETDQFIKDLAEADTGFVTGKMREQFIDGINFYKKIRKDPILMKDCKNIYITGHSLGGGIAALQYLYFYKTDKLLKEIRTFEAPGVGMIAHNASSPGSDFLGRHPEIYMSPKMAQKVSNILDKGDENYQYRKVILDNLKGLDKSKMIEYGTNQDYIYNDLPHIGHTKNPLSKNGVYQKVFPQILRKGISADVFHSMATYKIYELTSHDKINCGYINLENFFKLVLPLLASLKLNHSEVVAVLEKIYDGDVNSPADIKTFLVSRYRKNAGEYVELTREQFNRMASFQEQNKDSAYFNIYRYSVLFGFLKDSTDKTEFMSTAGKLIESDHPQLKAPEKSKAMKRHELSSSIAIFEDMNRVNDLRRDSMKSILKKTHGFVNKKDLSVYEFLLLDRHDSLYYKSKFSTKEKLLCTQYGNRYRRYCSKNKNIDDRVDQMGFCLFLMKSGLNNGTFEC